PTDLADEWLGLAAGFLFAGAQLTISTLWAVEDLSSGMLLSRFYHYLLREKFSATHALQKAQRWLRDKAGRTEAIRFADKAIALLQARLGDGALSESEAQSIETHLRKIENRKVDLGRGPSHPFREPFYWAPFTVSGFEQPHG